MGLLGSSGLHFRHRGNITDFGSSPTLSSPCLVYQSNEYVHLLSRCSSSCKSSLLCTQIASSQRRYLEAVFSCLTLWSLCVQQRPYKKRASIAVAVAAGVGCQSAVFRSFSCGPPSGEQVLRHARPRRSRKAFACENLSEQQSTPIRGCRKGTLNATNG